MLDGAAKIKPMVAEAVRLGQPALGITDHGYLFGAYEFYRFTAQCTRSGGLCQPMPALQDSWAVWSRQ